MKRRTLPDLPSAITWLRDHWSLRETPIRLHEHSSEGWGPYFAPAFARHLDAKPTDTAMVNSTRTCAHPRLVAKDQWECPDCQGTGLCEASIEAYKYPMWRAMERLGNGATKDVVLTLVINAYSVDDVTGLGIGESVILKAIRRLFAQYEQAPMKVNWVDKSSSQQQAEMVA